MSDEYYTNSRKKQIPDSWHFILIAGYLISVPFTIYYAIDVLGILADEWDGWKLLRAAISGFITAIGLAAWLVGGIDNKG